ncbi:hypothetical protein KFE25_008398 [Diacronema lutheri]|uniref:UBA domain-containing protein n=1 Tax=Diacronema lutheri TaxID=2081491 RepID=A0A8J6C4T9_DIALT|nr:hypothetical protein KFE25_008398 [Diacronema lutheri]
MDVSLDVARFAEELSALREMGFCDEPAALRALIAANGWLSAAVTRLLSASTPAADGAPADLYHEALFEEWADDHTKRCPSCHMRVEKNGGCDTITCRCGTCFCYLCGRESAECGERGCVSGGSAPAGAAMPPASDDPQPSGEADRLALSACAAAAPLADGLTTAALAYVAGLDASPHEDAPPPHPQAGGPIETITSTGGRIQPEAEALR